MQTMDIKRPNSLISKIFNSAFNQGKLSIVDELVAPYAVTHTGRWGATSSRTEIKKLIATFRTAFPDIHCSIEGGIKEDDKQATCWTMRGTHLGLYFGNRPTQRSIAVRGFFFARIEDSWIVENWILIEELRILQQLGIVPPL
jgi:predicted ester cyclase